MTRQASRRVWLLLVAAVVVIVAVVVVLVIRPFGGGPTQTLTYSADTGSIANPERGFYDRIDTIVTQRDFSSEKADGITLLHSYVQLDAFVDSPIDDATLSGLQQGLDAVRSAGLKIVLRFAYNQGPDSANGGIDAPLSVIEGHLKQLAPILEKNVDVIASVEAGFIGQWGEWHDSTNGLDKDLDAKKTVLSAVLAAVPSSRDVELRYPADYRAIEGTPFADSASDGSDVARVGNHQDCFLSSDPDDTGTYDRDSHSPAEDKAMIAKVGRYAFIGGETCNGTPPERTNCTTAIDEMTQMHFTYLNRDFEPNSLQKLKDEGCYDEIANRLGYRIGITSATLPKELAPGQSIDFSLALTNTGFGSIVNERPAYLVLTNGTTTEKLTLDTDPRDWDPAKTITVAERSLAQTSKLAPGRYKVALWLPDAAADLQANPAYAIHLASTGVWDAKTGFNVLGSVTITD
jgi:hypothetical protein